MSEKIIVPVLGESITEATVSKWLKNEGDEVKTDEPIVELETDKVNLEVPSPISGKLTEIISKNGSVVEVGAHLGSIEEIVISEKKSQKIEKIKPTVKRENIENSEPQQNEPQLLETELTDKLDEQEQPLVLTKEVKTKPIIKEKPNDQVLSPALITSRYILVQTSSDVLYVFNLSDGETVWSKKAQPSLLSIRGTSSPMLYEGLVFTSFSNGRLSANRITDGIQLWERPISVIRGSTELEKLKDSDSQAIAFEESVYAANFNGSLTRFNIRDGEKIFSVDLSTSKPLLMWRDTLLSSNTDDEIIQFDAINGNEKWRNSSFKYRKISNLVIHDGNLLFGDYEGYIHKLNLQNGEILGISKSKLNSIKNIAVISNDLIIQDDLGSIEVLSIF